MVQFFNRIFEDKWWCNIEWSTLISHLQLVNINHALALIHAAISYHDWWIGDNYLKCSKLNITFLDILCNGFIENIFQCSLFSFPTSTLSIRVIKCYLILTLYFIPTYMVLKIKKSNNMFFLPNSYIISVYNLPIRDLN